MRPMKQGHKIWWACSFILTEKNSILSVFTLVLFFQKCNTRRTVRIRTVYLTIIGTCIIPREFWHENTKTMLTRSNTVHWWRWMKLGSWDIWGRHSNNEDIKNLVCSDKTHRTSEERKSMGQLNNQSSLWKWLIKQQVCVYSVFLKNTP